MGNSLLEIVPHQVSRNLRGYSVMFYGEPKSGKTTIASRFPGSLILAFERGYAAIPGAMAKPINSWNELKKTLTELKDPVVQERFQTIVWDTGDIAYNLCKKYICSKESTTEKTYNSIEDIPYGKGYGLAQAEFDECLRKVIQMGYGLVIISHAVDKTFKNENGEEYSQIIPTIDNKGRLVCERTCDIIGYSRVINTEEGPKTKLFMRGTPRFIAGSRFRYTPTVIDFTYDNLVNAIGDAIDKEAMENNNAYVTENVNNKFSTEEEEKYNFPAMMEELQKTIDILISQSPENAKKISEVVETHLGRGRKVFDCTEDNAPIVDLILFDLKKILQ